MSIGAALDDMTVDVVHGDVPEESRFVRMLGCPDTRQFEVLELGGMILLRETPTKHQPNPGRSVARMDSAKLLKAMAAAVLKANDEAAAE